MIIRSFNVRDYPAVKNIYQQGIDTGHATFQRKAKNWEEWHNSMLSHSRLVAQENDHILDWAALSPISSRAVYSGVAEVSVYVSTSAQGKGVGQQLLSQLILSSEENGTWMLQASVFPENISSIKLHEKHDFRQVGVREKLGEMHNVWRDVVLLERRSKVVGILG